MYFKELNALNQKNEMLKATRLYKNRVYELPQFEIIKKGKVLILKMENG